MIVHYPILRVNAACKRIISRANVSSWHAHTGGGFMGDTMQSVDLVALLHQLRAEEAEYDRQLAAVRAEISTVEQALAIAQRRSMGAIGAVTVASSPSLMVNGPTPNREMLVGRDAALPTIERPSPARVPELARKIRGLKQIDALRHIAQLNEGIVRTIEIKPVFIKAGLTKGSPRNIGSHLYHLLDRSPEFEKIAPGTFLWLPHVEEGKGKARTDQAGPIQAALTSPDGETDRSGEKILAAGNPEGDAMGRTQEPPPTERNGYDRVGTVLPG